MHVTSLEEVSYNYQTVKQFIMTTAIISHVDCSLHNMGARHPESPDRLIAISQALIKSGLQQLLHSYPAPLVELSQLTRAHSKDYLQYLEDHTPQLPEDGYWLDGDTGLFINTLNAAKLAAGAAISAIEMVLQDKEQAAFCMVRPPGHHAGRANAMGFCYYNNIAVAAYHALEWGKIERIAIVDFDVHHGNGTEEIITGAHAGDQRIHLFSSFQHPFYPYSGAFSKASNVCNLPLPAGTDGVAYRAAVERNWLPRLDAFKPQLILFSAGFDGHALDGMAQFYLLEADYAWITEQVKQIADRHANGRLVSCLEGGYNLGALGNSVVAHIAALSGHSINQHGIVEQ